MSDQIGVLGEATTATAATTTVYTCPAAKAARGKIMWSGLSHGSTGTGDLTLTVNGINVAVVLNMTAAPTGATALLTVAPAPFEYFLSAGDTVTYTVGTLTMQSLNVQFVGTEIDV